MSSLLSSYLFILFISYLLKSGSFSFSSISYSSLEFLAINNFSCSSLESKYLIAFISSSLIVFVSDLRCLITLTFYFFLVNSESLNTMFENSSLLVYTFLACSYTSLREELQESDPYIS